MSSSQHRFDPALMHQAARMYYLEDANQALIAARLEVSRPTVSRLLAEARRSGMVQITVHPPDAPSPDTDPTRLAEALGLRRAWVAPTSGGRGHADLVDPVSAALRSAGLYPGDVLLVSSGRTVYELSRAALPTLPGVDLVPAVGGVAEPEAWHQTNEITRLLAERVRGRPHFLFAQAMPSAAMRATLEDDPDFLATTALWDRAKAALVGVGAPLVTRSSVSTAIPVGDDTLRVSVGDLCLNFFGPDGQPVAFPGEERMVRVGVQQLRRIPCTIAVAVGEDKVLSLIGGARAGLFNHLVTDAQTARAVLSTLAEAGSGGG